MTQCMDHSSAVSCPWLQPADCHHQQCHHCCQASSTSPAGTAARATAGPWQVQYWHGGAIDPPNPTPPSLCSSSSSDVIWLLATSCNPCIVLHFIAITAKSRTAWHVQCESSSHHHCLCVATDRLCISPVFMTFLVCIISSPSLPICGASIRQWALA